MQVKVGSPLVELSPDKQSMYITINIEEGPQYRLGKVDVTGNLLMPRSLLRARFGQERRDLQPLKLSDDLQKLTDYYKDRGYAYVNASPSTPVNEKTRVVDVFFEIQKGELVTVNRINIRGNNKTRDKVIRRELRLAEGDSYNQSLLDYSKKRVNALGYFEKVEMSTKRGRPTTSWTSTSRSPSARPGRSRSAPGSPRWRTSSPRPESRRTTCLAAGSSSPCRRSSPASDGSSCCSSRTSTSSTPIGPSASTCSSRSSSSTRSSAHSTGGSLTWGYLLAEDLRLLVTYKLEQVSIGTNSFGFGGGLFGTPTIGVPITTSGIANLFRSGITSSVRATLSYDSRNDRMFPAAAGTTPSPPRSPTPTSRSPRTPSTAMKV